MYQRKAEQHSDFNLDTLEVRLKSMDHYIKYLKHLVACRLADGDMVTVNNINMIIKDLETLLNK